MKRLMASLIGALPIAAPSLAFASYAGAGYRGIASLYYTFIALVLVYGVYDTFGKNVGTHISASVIVIGAYLLVQLAPE